MFPILLSLNHLHDKGICHRDIKPDNFIFKEKHESSELKMIDFGLSKSFRNSILKSFVGTSYYIAPELLKNRAYDEKCDYWSLGVMMYLMLSG